MKLKNLVISLLALSTLSLTSCFKEDNPVGGDNTPAALNVVNVSSVDADNGIWVKPISWLSNWNVEFTVEFDDDVVINQANPTGISLVNVYNGKAIEEKSFEETQWVVKPGENSKSVTVRLENAEGSVIGVVLKDEAFKFTVPAGIVSNAAGTASNPEVSGVVYSSAVAKEREGVPSALTVVSTLPEDYEDYAWVKANPFATTWNINFVVTFDEDVVVANENPEGITLNNVYNGKSIIDLKNLADFGAVNWKVESVDGDSKAVRVRLVDADFGSTKAAALKDEGYKLTIPAGVVANVAGNVKNGEITATVYSSQAAIENNGRPTALTSVSVLPEDYENYLWVKANLFGTTWNINFVLTFDEPVKVAQEKPEGITLNKRGTTESIIDLKNLTEFGEVYWKVEAIDDNPNAVRVRLVDADFGGTKAVKLEDEAYRLNIPAGIVTNLAGDVANGALNGTFYSSEAAQSL